MPIKNYFCPEVYETEQARIFNQSSIYVGHELMVSELGDWHALPFDNNSRVLIQNSQGIELLSNVCRHRQALMLGTPIPQNADSFEASRGNLGSSKRIRCPIHAWSYDDTGKQARGPRMNLNECTSLQNYPLQNVSGFLFEGARQVGRDLNSLFKLPEFDFSHYKLDKIELHPCPYNWKLFIEIYNEEYHIAPFHPGLRTYVDSSDLEWVYGDWHNVQRIQANADLNKGGTKAYEFWHERLLNRNKGRAPRFGAIWTTYYPTHMIEVYPFALVLSTLYPQSVNETLNVVEFYYPEELIQSDPEFIEAHRLAYMETAIEDDEIAERIEGGRRALYKRGLNEYGPYQTPLEDGIEHFYRWYHDRMRD
ncbi:aromatic ring-hydroxylating dioxygenase subunit alpha [bacterium AH-315-K03]|nr:aromatic ring-hydroxylating dioxygenase subunit alpha [bacterium AH-315-K03]